MSAILDWNSQLIRVTRPAFLAIGIIAASGAAMAQNRLPDAQVEANVLKALAGAPELANQSITTKTVYGTVTLSGSVTDENARTKAENLTANAAGVVKVVDELQLGSGNSAPANVGQQAATPHAPGTVLLSDGTYGADPAAIDASKAQRNNPDADQALDQQAPQSQPGAAQPPTPPSTASNQPAYPAQPSSARRPMYPAYPQSQYGYPQQGAYAQQPGQRPVVGGQEAGQPVTIPPGAMLRVRLNRTLSSKLTPAGTSFDGTIVNDVVADGLVAIPRGATVQGTVVAATSSGVLKGRGELSIQLTSITLGGKSYPVASDLWAHNGSDKTIETVNKTLGLGALGAIVGAVAGGGRGAAIGGGVGAAAGVGSSAATGDRQVYLPAEAIVIFHTTQPAQVATVSEQEMQRLAYGVPAAGAPPVQRGYRAYPGSYPPPGYYPYPAYGYPQQ